MGCNESRDNQAFNPGSNPNNGTQNSGQSTTNRTSQVVADIEVINVVLQQLLIKVQKYFDSSINITPPESGFSEANYSSSPMIHQGPRSPSNQIISRTYKSTSSQNRGTVVADDIKVDTFNAPLMKTPSDWSEGKKEVGITQQQKGKSDIVATNLNCGGGIPINRTAP